MLSMIRQELQQMHNCFQLAGLASSMITKQADQVRDKVGISAIEAIRSAADFVSIDRSELLQKSHKMLKQVVDAVQDLIKKDKDVEKSDKSKETDKVIRMALNYVISNEDTLLSSSEDISESESKIEHKWCAHFILDYLDGVDDFHKMNLGAKCWFFHRLWQLSCLMNTIITPPDLPPLMGYDTRQHYFKFVATCSPRVVEFVQWMIGTELSYHQLQQVFDQPDQPNELILPPLTRIIHQYIQPPDPLLLKQEILSLIFTDE